MANHPTGQNSFGFLSNAAYEMEQQAGGTAMGGESLLGFDSKEEGDEKESHRLVTPLNMLVPGGMQWTHGTLADGIISVAGNEGKERVHASHGGIVADSGGSNDSLVVLELGKRTYYEVPGGSGGGITGQTSSQAPPKKPRIAGQTPKCQVKGCTADLSSAKDYHRRHKVCGTHSKAARVIVQGKEGKEQRFCQQCSRFHSITEFDEGKRSCRKRLAGHNERRRKPQPDALGPNARFLPAFQDSSRLGQLFTDGSSFLPRVRIPGMSALWDDPSQHKGAWPPTRMLSYEDQSSFECSMPAGTGMERPLFTSGLHHPERSSTLFSPQSPKGMIPVSADVTGPKTHQYFQASVDPLGQSLSLTSPSGAGVLSGLEAIPVGQGFARVSDSGRALSLQSTMQLLSSTQGSVAATLDMETHSNMIIDHSLRNSHIPMAQPLVQGGQQLHQFEWAQNKLLSAASSLHSLSSGIAGYHAGCSAIEKDHLEEPFPHGSLNAVGSYECVPLYSMLHGDVQMEELPQDVKPTIDLMQVASSSHGENPQPLVSSGSFDLGISHFGDLQALRGYEPSIFSSQQM